MSTIPDGSAQPQSEFDYIVVGAGSAGCIVAAELSEEPTMRVLLLEAGGPAEDNPETLRADGYRKAFINDDVIKERFSEPQPGCGGNRLFMGSGRGVGGSGGVNAMVYTRGSESDYAMWNVKGWQWSDVAPLFSELESRIRPHRMPPTEFTESCIGAAEACGFARKDDLNDGSLKGAIGYEWMNAEGSERRSAYVSFLKDRLDRNNLRLVTRARARRVLFDGARAAGVEYAIGHQCFTATATREVILCAGALETPKLLLLSGVGPADELRALGIDVVADVPGIGRNLQDHPNVVLFSKAKREVDCDKPQLYGFHRANLESRLPEAQADTCYVFYPARSSFKEGVIRLLPSMILPPWLYRFAWLVRALRSVLTLLFGIGAISRFVDRMYGVVVILGKPKSRGALRLASRDPDAPARIDPAYFKEREDLDTLLAGVARARGMTQSPPLAAWGNQELIPGRGKQGKSLERWVRRNAITTYHFAGTCRMGDDADAPLDGRLRLRGVSGLRVADASAIPVVPVSALNAPSMLIGLRAARFLREEITARS